MQKLKDTFTFKVNKVTCIVKKQGNDWYAVSGTRNVKLKIEIYNEDHTHKGEIRRASDGKHLSWLPLSAIEETADTIEELPSPMEVLKQISELLKTIGL